MASLVFLCCLLSFTSYAAALPVRRDVGQLRPSSLMDFGKLGNAPLVPEFKAYARSHGKVYKSVSELFMRFEAFTKSFTTVQRVNAAGLTYRLALNVFADWTAEEKRQRLGVWQNCSATGRGGHTLTNQKPPATKDWRAEGIVTPVKSQGKCGSCWTFSTVAALEAAVKQKTGELVTLSEQQLVDCAGAFNNFGCDGGLPSQAFEYIKFAGGIDTAEAYPYEAVDGPCRFNKNAIGTQVKGSVNITEFDETELIDAVGFVRPVSIAYEVLDDFFLYHSGVYSSPECHTAPDMVNHAVLAVGYSLSKDEYGVPYWILKNSWGSDWGDHGFFKMELGKNMCGIATCASYPIL